MEGDDDSNAPEEFSMQQGFRQEEDIRKVLKENKTRVAREVKERRRKWAQSKSLVSSGDDVVLDVTGTEPNQEAQDIRGLLPDSIVNLLAAQEKIIFPESEEEVIDGDDKSTLKRKKSKMTRPEAVILKDLPPPECLRSSMEFLKNRKMRVSRSPSVLKNSDQALRLLHTNGFLSKG